MRLHDLDTPVERHTILHYGADGNKVVRHNYDMQQISGALYKGAEETNEYGEIEYNIFVVFPNVRHGLLYQKKLRDREDLTTEKMEVWAKEYGIDTLENYLEKLDETARDGRFIGRVEIEFVRQFDAERAERYAAARLVYVKRKEEQYAAERERRETENAAYVKEKNDEAEAVIQTAIATIKSGNGKIGNDEIEIFKSRYTSNTYALVNVLCRRYNVEVPLRTQGWIAKKLGCFVVENGKHKSIMWQPEKRGEKPSQTIHKYLEKLVEAICASDTEV